jgi:hypothetical protein
MIPRMDVYERMLRGTNDNGMNIMKEMSFQEVDEMVGMRALRESANRTTSATLKSIERRTNHVAVSSSEKSIDTTI